MKELSELALPDRLKYAKDHEWIAAEPPYRIGVSDFAQDQLGDITFAELPEVGTELGKGDEFGTLESIKSVSSLYLPVAGKIVAVNETLVDEPGLVNSDPYGQGWLIQIEPADAGQLDELMDSGAYAAFLEENA